MNDTADKISAGRLLWEKTSGRNKRETGGDAGEETVQVVIFSLQGELFAFAGETVRELMPPRAVYTVPGTPDFIPGVINVRGQIESVITINRFLGLSGALNAGKSRIAMAEKEGLRSGILVDSVEDVVDIPASSIKEPLGTLSPSIKEFVSGEFFFNNTLVILLDVGRIFRKIAS